MTTRREYVNYLTSLRGAYGPGKGLRNNDNPFNTWYYGRRVSGDDYAWCEVIEKYVQNHFEILKLNGGKSAYVPSMAALGRGAGAKVWHRPTSVPKDGTSWNQEGNLLVFAFTSGSSGSHTETLIKRLSSTTVKTFGGNTESDLGSDVADFKQRSVHDILYVIELLGVDGSSNEGDWMADLQYISLGMSAPQAVKAGTEAHANFDVEYGDEGDAHAGDGKGTKKDSYPGIMSGSPKKTQFWGNVEVPAGVKWRLVETDPKNSYKVTKEYPSRTGPYFEGGKVEPGQHLYLQFKDPGTDASLNAAVKFHYVKRS